MVNAGGVNIPVGADTEQLRKDMEALKALFGNAMNSIGSNLDQMTAMIKAVEQAERSRASLFDRTMNETKRLFDLVKVGARETSEALAKVKLDPEALKVPSAAYESLTKWKDQAAYAVGAGTAMAVDKARSLWEDFKGFTERQVVIWGVALAAGVSAAVVGAVYAAYKTISFATGLLTGESYKSANIDALSKMNEEVKKLQENLPLTAAGASALNEALKAQGLSADGYSTTMNSVSSAVRNNEEELKRLGVQFKNADGSIKSNEDVLKGAAAVLATYKAGWDRAQVAQAIGMGSEKQIQDAISVTAGTIATAKERLIDYGLVIGTETQAAVKRYETSMRAFTRESDLTGQGIKRALADNVMPILTDLADFFRDGFPSAVMAFRYSLATVTSLFYGLKTVVYMVSESVVGSISSIGSVMGGLATAAGLALKGDFSGAKDALIKGWEDAKARLGGIGDNIVEQARRNAAAMRQAWGSDSFGAAADPNAAPRPGKTWVPPPPPAKPVIEAASAYDTLMKSIAQHTAIEAQELATQVQLTDAQKIAQKAMVELRDGRLDLTEAQKVALVTALEGLLALDNELVKRKLLEEAVKRDLAAAMEAEREFKRRQQVVADFNTTQQQAVEDLKFETELLKLEAQLNGAGLLLKEDEIRLQSKVNTEREIAIGLRKIEADYQRAAAQLGRDEEASDYAELIRLQQLTEARKAALPDLIAARETQKMVNDLNKNSVSVFNSMWSAAENMGRQTFAYLTGQGVDSAKAIGKAFKSSVFDVLYQLTARPFMIQVGTSVAGAMGVSTAASAASSATGTMGGNMLSSLFANTPSIGTALSNFGTGISTFTTMLGEGAGAAEAFSAAAAGMGPSMMAIAPYLGAAVLAASALGLFDSGGPKASDAYLRRGANGQFGVEMNNVAGGDPNMALVLALNDALNDSTKFDAGKLASLVGTGVGTGSPADTAALINLLTQALGPAADAAKVLAEETKKVEEADRAAAEAAAALAAERRGLEIRLMEAMGDAAGALAAKREDELAATSEANRALLQQIYAAEDLAVASKAAADAQAEQKRIDEEIAATELARAREIASQRKGLQDQLDTLTMSSTELLGKQRLALDESNRALFDQIQSLVAAQAAEKERTVAIAEAEQVRKQIAAERHGLEIRLIEAQGDAAAVLAARRADELAGTNDLNRELLRQIFAAEDLAKATAAATQAAVNAAAVQKQIEQDRETAVLGAVAVLKQAYDRESSDLTSMIGKWEAAGASLRAYSQTLATGSGGGASYGSASSAFNSVAARTRLGDLTAIGNLQSVSETFRAASLAHSATQVDYLRDIGRIQAAIADAVGVTDRQGSVAQQQLDTLHNQVAALIDINDSVVSVADAIEDLNAEISSLKTSSDKTASNVERQEQFLRSISPDGRSIYVTVAA